LGASYKCGRKTHYYYANSSDDAAEPQGQIVFGLIYLPPKPYYSLHMLHKTTIHGHCHTQTFLIGGGGR
jgi:hypothetical protein